MYRMLRASGAVAALAFTLGVAGCVSQPSTTNTNTTTNTTTTNTNTTANTSASPVTTASPASEASTSNGASLPVTLPVLDAMFADEKFAGELKSKLQLTDEQVEKLRTAAREQTASLSESDEHSGTTSAASARASGKIKEIVGEEKAAQLVSLVRERWTSGGEEGGAGSNASAAASTSGKPNAIPSDTRIVVNAPAYRMDVFEGGKLLKSYKVGIGYPEFPLPTGQRKASSIIFNPTWTPPDEPWVESSNKVKAGQKVAAGSKLNPLGPIKIPIGLPSLIHGGKSPAKLGSFASHGCVGLTTPQVQDFAVVLAQLAKTDLKKEDVDNYAKNKTETKSVKLDQPVPVELRYETIVVEDGKLHIYRDVYDHDTNTEENLRAVLSAYGVTLEQLSEDERTKVLQALKQMARDATGNPTDATPAASPTPEQKSKAGDKTSGKASDKAEPKITRSIKGTKEVVIEIAALQGKGYPAPVGGGFESPKTAPSKKPAATSKSGKRS